MTIKYLLLAISPLLCGGTDTTANFLKSIGDEESKDFYTNVFDEIRKCGVFDMDGTIINNALLSPVLAYQVRKMNFAFSWEHVDLVFGFKSVSEDDRNACIAQEYTLTDSVKVKFEDLVKGIKDILFKYDAAHGRDSLDQKVIEKLGALIAVWSCVTYSKMKDNNNCNYLASTLKYRLLYKMSLEERKNLIKYVLAHEPKAAGSDKYDDKGIKFRLRNHSPSAYPQQLAFIKKLKHVQVTPIVISASPKLYLEALNEVLGIGIDSKNLHGSYPNAH
uniref:AlNc14C578G12202 protein n=1 Tax=Albugo laibachii Nc14 TaxID=890382 RepID=F0X1B3_9STRA|nr:AlNc14C578G12202 [Albugo laibachii Nc14]|eukprot:CCA27587.1 AlNc14C578G12202 [Albugo laibachii Nc14]